MKKLKTEINLLLEKEELSNRIRIIDEEKIAKLKETSDIPNGIDMYGMDYYEFERAEFSDSELDAYIKLRYLKSIDTIKKVLYIFCDSCRYRWNSINDFWHKFNIYIF